MDDSKGVFLKRQRALADFGDFALQSEDLDEVLTEACRLVGEAMATGRAKVLEIEEGGRSLLVRAGVGWKRGILGKLRLPADENSPETYSIRARRPVITQDVSKEDRFEIRGFMKKAGVVALANVPVLLPGGRAYGLLQVDDTKPRDFGQEDTEFLRTYASILGPVIDRLFKLRDLRSSEERFRLIVEEATDYAILVTDRDDRITDWLPGAAAVFGWNSEEVIGNPGAVHFLAFRLQRLIELVDVFLMTAPQKLLGSRLERIEIRGMRRFREVDQSVVVQEQHEEDGNSVNPHVIVDAPIGEPSNFLDELELITRLVKPGP